MKIMKILVPMLMTILTYSSKELNLASLYTMTWIMRKHLDKEKKNQSISLRTEQDTRENGY